MSSRSGWILAILLGLLVAPLLLPGGGGSPHGTTGAEHRWTTADLRFNTQAAYVVPVVYQATATIQSSVVQNFWQNLSGDTEVTSSTPVNFAAGAPLSLPVSYVLSNSVTVYPSAQSGLLPRVLEKQGTTQLTNSTVPYSIALNPTVSATTGITQTVPNLYTTAGTAPANGHYLVWSNATTLETYQSNASVGWNGGGVAFKLTYQVAAPIGVNLNATSIFVPFPSVGINTSSVAVYVGKTSVSNLVVAANGVYAKLPSVSAGNTVTINTTLSGSAKTTGAVPVLQASGYLPYGQNTGLYTFNVTWVNPYSIPYAGAFFLAANLTTPIDPARLTIIINQTNVLSSNATATAGYRAEILPNIISVVPGSRIFVQVIFGLVGAPPTLTIAGGTPVTAIGSYTLSFRGLLAAVILALPALLIGLWVYRPEIARSRSIHIDFGLAFGLAVAIFLVV